MEKNIFVFTFEHETDLNLTFNRRSWSIRGVDLVLKTWKPYLTWKEVDFSSSTFWVQVHKLPLFWQNKEYLDRIGKEAGIVKGG